jgi:hypothetical protein
MRERLALLLIAAALAACSSQSDRQLQAVKSARSVIAEWALVEEQAAEGRTQPVYVEQMRQLAKQQLGTDRTGLAGRPNAAELLDKLRTGSPDAGTLKAAGSALEPLEKQLEVS